MNKLQMLKKGSLVALGLASITTKKADVVISELIKKGRLGQKEGETLARKVISETMKEQSRIRKQVLNEVGESAKRVMTVVRDEANRLVEVAKKSKNKPKVKPKIKVKKKKR